MSARGHRRRKDRPRSRPKGGPKRLVVDRIQRGKSVFFILECGHEKVCHPAEAEKDLAEIKHKQCRQCAKKENHDAQVRD